MCICIGALILVILIICSYFYSEGFEANRFASSREKGAAISEWFNNNNSASYSKYKKDLDNKSNVLEYYKVKGAQHAGKKITPDSVITTLAL